MFNTTINTVYNNKHLNNFGLYEASIRKTKTINVRVERFLLTKHDVQNVMVPANRF